jgi:SpoVK/Ycf46/Vps4 family AAA+-type ATPase
LLGKKHGLDVYRIDLSQLSSKYIGETEKNIANLFKQARNKSWILFFDEGESLFGKRTSSGGNNEKYANQQVGFLLQMIEDHPGVVILATNLKSSIDEAFLRRFQKMIYFESPDDTQRLELWQKALNLDLLIDSDIDLKKIAKDYLVVGGQIVNIVKQASLRALGNNNGVISQKILLQCITEELKKN